MQFPPKEFAETLCVDSQTPPNLEVIGGKKRFLGPKLLLRHGESLSFSDNDDDDEIDYHN